MQDIYSQIESMAHQSATNVLFFPNKEIFSAPISIRPSCDRKYLVKWKNSLHWASRPLIVQIKHVNISAFVYILDCWWYLILQLITFLRFMRLKFQKFMQLPVNKNLIWEKGNGKQTKMKLTEYGQL